VDGAVDDSDSNSIMEVMEISQVEVDADKCYPYPRIADGWDYGR
jgi:hypothetical protein